MNSILAWVTDPRHVLIVAVAWAVFTAGLTFLFRKHTDDEYAQLPSWLGHVLRFCEGLGVSAPRVIAFAQMLFFPNAPPPTLGMRLNLKTPAIPPPPPPPSRMRRAMWPAWALAVGVSLSTILIPASVTVGLATAETGCLTPAQIKTAEDVTNFLEADACLLATEFAPGASVEEVATVCGYIQSGTKLAEDIYARIVQMLESKTRAKDPAIKAKYAARLRALHPTDAGSDR